MLTSPEHDAHHVPSTHSFWASALLALLLVCLAAVPFLYNLTFQFVGPDVELMSAQVSQLKSGSWTAAFWSSTSKPRLHPLTNATYYSLFSPTLSVSLAQHAFHILLHLATSVLLFLSLIQILRKLHSPSHAQRHFLTAFIITLLWAIHPLVATSVSYLIHRGEILMAFFAAGMLLSHLHASNKSIVATAAAVLCYLFGLASKELMLLMPLILLMFDYTLSAGSLLQILRARRMIYAFYALITVGGIVWLFAHGWPQQAIQQPQLLAYINAQPAIFSTYLTAFLWPIGLCPEYNWPLTSPQTSLSSTTIILLLVSTLMLLAPLIHRKIGGFLAIFILLVVPRSLVGFGDAYGEYRMYLPTFLLMAATISLIQLITTNLVGRLKLPQPAVRAAFSGLFLLAYTLLAVGCYQENYKYHDLLTFWETIYRRTSTNPRAFEVIAQDAFRLEENQAAILALESANSLRKPGDPQIIENRYQIATILESIEQYSLAIDQYNQVLTLSVVPAQQEILIQSRLVKLLQKLKNFDQAQIHVDRMLSLAEQFPGTIQTAALSEKVNLLVERAAALTEQGNFPQAQQLLDQALALDSNSLRIHLDRAKLASLQGDVSSALKQYEDILAIKPSDLSSQCYRADALITLGRTQEGVSELVRLITQHPNVIDPKRLLAWHLSTHPVETVRDPEVALQLAQEVCNAEKKEKDQESIDGIQPESFCTLAAAFAENKNFEAARECNQLAISLALQAGRTYDAAQYKSHLDAYLKDQPFRQSLASSLPESSLSTPDPDSPPQPQATE